MKPGMQRDILVAFWFLFDEFEIGYDDPPHPDTLRQPDGASKPGGVPAKENPGSGRRSS